MRPSNIYLKWNTKVPWTICYTVKPANAVTCIKRSHVSCLVIENFIWIEPLLRGHLSYQAIFSLSQRWPLNTGLTIIHNRPRLFQSEHNRIPYMRFATLSKHDLLKNLLEIKLQWWYLDFHFFYVHASVILVIAFCIKFVLRMFI
jgi:imidazoleglycerol phosphate synthase glutamine amidotransferase subunit HisH